MSENGNRGMVEARIFVTDSADLSARGPTVLEFTLALEAPDFPRACVALDNVGIFVEHYGEHVWYPPHSIVKVVEVKKAMVT